MSKELKTIIKNHTVYLDKYVGTIMKNLLTHIKPRLIFTQGVEQAMKAGTLTGMDVVNCVKRFNDDDWGDVAEGDRSTLEANNESLKNGGEGMVLGTYLRDTLWIIRNTESTTVLLPSEY